MRHPPSLRHSDPLPGNGSPRRILGQSVNLLRLSSALRSRYAALLQRFLAIPFAKKTAKGALFVFSLQVGGLLLTYASQALLARSLGASHYGVYRYCWSWYMLLATFTSLGFPTVYQKYIPRYQVHASWDAIRGLLRGTRRLVLLASTLSAVLVTAVAFYSSASSGENTFLLRNIAFFAWLIPLIALLNINTHIGRALHLFAPAFIPYTVGRPLVVLLASFLLLAALSPSAAYALALIGFGLFLLFLLQSFWLSSRMPSSLKTGQGIRYFWKPWLSMAIPLVLITGFGVALTQMGVLLTGHLLSTVDAGILAATIQTSTLVSFFLAALNTVVAPTISHLYHAGDIRGLQQLLSTTIHWVFWPSLLLAILLGTIGRSVLLLFGPQFAQWDAYLALLLLLVGQVINAATGPVGQLLYIAGQHYRAAIILFGTTLLQLVLGLLLIPSLGLPGAAVSTALSQCASNIAFVSLSRRHLHLSPSILASLARAR